MYASNVRYQLFELHNCIKLALSCCEQLLIILWCDVDVLLLNQDVHQCDQSLGEERRDAEKLALETMMAIMNFNRPVFTG